VSAERPAVAAVSAAAEASGVGGFGEAPAGGADHGRADRESAWASALAEMESVADAAEALLRAARTPGDEPVPDVALTTPWRVPRGLGALPAALAPRAAALVERQRDLVQRTAEQLGEHRRSLRLAEAMRTRAHAAPAYLDAEA